MRILAYSGNAAVINEIKDKLVGRDIAVTQEKDKFLELAYDKNYDQKRCDAKDKSIRLAKAASRV